MLAMLDVLIVILAVTEATVGFVFYKVGLKMWLVYQETSKLNNNIDAAKVEILGVKEKLSGIYSYLKSLDGGKVHIQGESYLLGKVDLELQLGKKKDGG